MGIKTYLPQIVHLRLQLLIKDLKKFHMAQDMNRLKIIWMDINQSVLLHMQDLAHHYLLKISLNPKNQSKDKW